jgi:hypothetical protein
MGQEASCCGNTQKTTRTGGKITYDGKKKLHIDSKQAKKKKDKLDRSTNSSQSSK